MGFGLIGGSMALAIRRNLPDVRITAIDRSRAVLDTALRTNLADSAGEDLSLADAHDLIVLGAPVRQNIEILAAIADRVRGDALVTDVGSTKADTIEAARALPPRIRFIGGHPIAGAALGGLEGVRRDLFQGRPWILTPLPEDDPRATRPDDLDTVQSFVKQLGAVPCLLAPLEHDRVMAYVSHLPQFAISALMHVVGERVGHDGLLLAGNGLRDSTRLAASPAGTWRDIASTNAPEITAAIADLIAVLERLKEDAARGEELTRVFDSAARWKGFLD
ncbi:MAG TPA: prephenate dehydrogenase [Vicinamibacterales bacterium]